LKENDNEAGRPHFGAFSVRLQHIIHLDAMMDFSVFSEEVKAMLNNDLKDVVNAFTEANYAQTLLGNLSGIDALEEALGKLTWDGHVGFLVKAQQPYFMLEENGQLGYSWERSRTKWFFARGYPSAIQHVTNWARTNHEGAWAHAREHQKDAESPTPEA
jgi:hypothetical protein